MAYQSILSLLFLFFMTGCLSNQADQPNKPYNGPVLGSELDTAKAISDMQLVEQLDKTQLIAKDTRKGLSDKIDTLDLTYHFGFCDCQRWIKSDIYQRVKQDYPDLGNFDPRGRIEFNLTEHGFYIEPAHRDLTIDFAQFNGNQIRLIGREYEAMGLPRPGRFTVPNPPEGRVFRYYAYEVIRPFTVWGPKVIDTIYEDPPDTLIRAAQITIR
ncbi:MAG: hypothetical protein AAF598_04110 [Bacteroidota bacterium]